MSLYDITPIEYTKTVTYHQHFYTSAHEMNKSLNYNKVQTI